MISKLASGCFLGTVLSRRAYHGIVLTETRHHQRDWLPVHAHQNAYFCLVRRGQFVERYGQRERLCKPMMLTFHPPEELHSEKIESPVSCSFNIEIETAVLEHAGQACAVPMKSQECTDKSMAHLAMRLQQEFSLNDAVSPLAVEGLTLELLAGLLRSQRPRDAVPIWLRRIRDLLQDRFQEPLSLEELSSEAGIHPVYLVQCFRRHFRCTPGHFQRQLRVEFARDKLTKTMLSLSEIALLAGFADQSHLTRWFKQFTGITPARYRAAHRE